MPSRRRSATTTAPAWTKKPSNASGLKPLQAGTRSHRRRERQSVVDRGHCPGSPDWAQSAVQFLFVARPAQCQRSHRLHRPGRAVAARPRLLPQRRSQDGGRAQESGGVCDATVHPGRPISATGRRFGADRLADRDRAGQSFHGPHRAPRSQESRPQNDSRRSRCPGAQFLPESLFRRHGYARVFPV